MNSIYPYILLSLLGIYYASPFETNGEFSIVAAFVKGLPIVYLIFYMKSNLKSKSAIKENTDNKHWKEQSHLATYVTYGFIFSLIGDVALLPRLKDECYLIAGTLAFAVSQSCYIYAFGFKATKIKRGLIIYALAAALSTFILWDVKSPLKLILTGYGTLLVTSQWRAMDRMKYDDGRSDLQKILLPIGLFSFLLSDMWLSFTTFVLKETTVTSMHYILFTYYTSQGLTAISST